MEVHPPHHPLHTWRDFFIHIATITIGLLIAIGLEQSVEYIHHRHIVHVARENILSEMEANRGSARKDIANVQANADNMKVNVEKARLFRDVPNSMKHGEMHFTFAWDSFSDSAWRSARDSGALTFMPIEEVQRYADAYSQQDFVNRQAIDIFSHQTDLAAPLFMEKEETLTLPREEAQQLLQGSAVTYLRLMTLNQLIAQLDKQYEQTLKPV